MNELPVLSASTTIDVSPVQARAWFLSLAEHPERYRFASHMGVTFTEGSFGRPGARFQTEERFSGIRLTLKFELIEVQDRRFTFLLLEPLRGVWGHFSLEPRTDGTTALTLAIGSRQRSVRLLLQLPFIRSAIETQIQREVTHIQRSMESLYKEETWAS
jgi:hypothetical protein